MKWALVLSGGGAKGFAHIGLIKEIEKNNFPPPSFIAGTSMGAIIGAMYADGWTSKQMEDYALNFDIKKFIGNPAFKMPDIPLKRLFQMGIAVGTLINKVALESGEKAEAELRAIFKSKNIEKLKIPFACISTDIIHGKILVHTSGNLALSLRASASFPLLFKPVKFDNTLLVDGGVLNNLPCDIAKINGYKNILACNVSPFDDSENSKAYTSLSLGLRCFDVAINRVQSQNSQLASKLITIYDKRETFDFSNPARIIEQGRKAAEEAKLKAFFKKKWMWPF